MAGAAARLAVVSACCSRVAVGGALGAATGAVGPGGTETVAVATGVETVTGGRGEVVVVGLTATVVVIRGVVTDGFVVTTLVDIGTVIVGTVTVGSVTVIDGVDPWEIPGETSEAKPPATPAPASAASFSHGLMYLERG